MLVSRVGKMQSVAKSHELLVVSGGLPRQRLCIRPVSGL